MFEYEKNPNCRCTKCGGVIIFCTRDNPCKKCGNTVFAVDYDWNTIDL